MSVNRMTRAQRRWFNAIRASLARDLLDNRWRDIRIVLLLGLPNGLLPLSELKRDEPPRSVMHQPAGNRKYLFS